MVAPERPIIYPDAVLDTSILRATCSCCFTPDAGGCCGGGGGEACEEEGAGDVLAEILAESVSTLSVFIVGVGDLGINSSFSMFVVLVGC